MQNNLVAESLHAVEREGASKGEGGGAQNARREGRRKGGWLHKMKYIAHGAMYE
ncbi:hypothetical protein EJ02DRAFT_457972 [Clathrospora elynae]|uniref:Uncharacterized protein n=1 Tax=Clathrospora elynae TaxID=706981 RepID=A0A6A5SCE1_9PLEO|nr:hypothetical protein EJ02DRAFT_457972 [Clathrospora elynae]